MGMSKILNVVHLLAGVEEEEELLEEGEELQRINQLLAARGLQVKEEGEVLLVKERRLILTVMIVN